VAVITANGFPLLVAAPLGLAFWHTLTPRTGLFLGLAGLNSLLGAWCYYRALEEIGATRASPIRSLSPLFSTWLAILFLAEEMTLPIGLGTLLLVAGAVMVSRQSPAGRAGARGKKWLGNLAALGAAFFLALYPLLMKLSMQEGVSPFQAVLVSQAVALGLCIPLLKEPGVRHAFRALGPGERWLFSGGGLLLGLTMLSYMSALDLGLAIIVVPLYSGLVPVLVALLSLALLRGLEYLTIALLLATLLVAAGSTLLVLF